MHPLVYDSSGWELSLGISDGLRAWTFEQLRGELIRRAEQEKRAREVQVHYYRIGQTVAFELPVAKRPIAFPTAWEGFDRYPWLTWLAWRLEERWWVLHAAWRQCDDAEAGRIFQRELGALAGWEALTEPLLGVNLVTGHLAGCLALGLEDELGWDRGLLERTREAGAALLERDVRAWAKETWEVSQPLSDLQIHNIRMATLVRSAQLARVIGHSDGPWLNGVADRAVGRWLELRRGAHHTEGFAYDGFLMDHITGWMQEHPGRAALLGATAGRREAWESLREEWIGCALSGRVDIQAPVGDVEPEMPFWMTALGRLADWCDWQEGRWLLRRCAPIRLPAAALSGLLERESDWGQERAPRVRMRDMVSAISLRHGWESDDVMVTVGCPRTGRGHLHKDGGHVVIGKGGRFWITDPGYQQYRPGLEREYTLGLAAHNGPVIDGKMQTQGAAKVLAVEEREGRQIVRLDLTECYEGLGAGAKVHREVWLETGGDVTVRDAIECPGPGVSVAYHWQGGTQLAWGFVEGWARFSDGVRALWIGTSGGALGGEHVTKLEGSRGPLTLADRRQTIGDRWECTWRFVWDDAAGWKEPEEHQ
jgi:hypothetical protein